MTTNSPAQTAPATASKSESLQAASWGKNSEPDLPEPARPGSVLLQRFADDQRAIWASPFSLRRSDAIWALPAVAGVGVLFASDRWFANQVPAGEITRSRSFSNYGTFSLAGAAGGMFLMGKITHNDHAAEAGFLAGEAALNAAAVDFALKAVFERQRPDQGNGAGHFFAGGASFPSEHAAVSWAIAGVVAHEYPGRMTKLMAYGMASAVTVARVTGKEHFPSDVVVGGALGYFIARQIFERRRDPETSAAVWGSEAGTRPSGENPRLSSSSSLSPLSSSSLTSSRLSSSPFASGQDKLRSPRNVASSSVPPDSWVYPLLERLAAMGYIHTAYLGIRPWTRMQCARLVEEAGESLGYASDAPGEAGQLYAAGLYAALSREFAEETRRLEGAPNVGLEADSIYERTTSIAGPPLTDGYHFAQTVINDYGRPYGRGFNIISGVAGHAEAGMLSFSLQGEYQQAAAVPGYAAGVQQAIAAADQVPVVPGGSAPIRRFAIVSSAVGVTFHDLQFCFGKQAQWLGPGEGGPFLASTNAPNILMFQAGTVVPYRVPLVSRWLGPAQSVFFVGQLTGQSFVYNPPNIVGPGFHPQPFIHGNKVSFKPTANFEFGMGVTAIFGGPGLPFTWGEFFRSYYAHNASIGENPAKRFSGFDFTYRVPGLRRWLTVYNDSLVGDEISPIGSTRPMLSPGVYMPRVPKLEKLELRLEGVKDPFTSEFLPGFVYYDRRYRSGYTNGGSLIGSWVGRDGFGAQGQATYWFSPQIRMQSGYRYQEADRSFLEGGRLTEYWLRAETRLASGFTVSAFVQYEQWMFPLLAASRQANVSSQLQLAFHPLGWARR